MNSAGSSMVERVLWILSYDGNVRQYLLSTFNGEVGSSNLPRYNFQIFFIFFNFTFDPQVDYVQDNVKAEYIKFKSYFLFRSISPAFSSFHLSFPKKCPVQEKTKSVTNAVFRPLHLKCVVNARKFNTVLPPAKKKPGSNTRIRVNL